MELLRLNPELYSALTDLVLTRDNWQCRYCHLRNNLHCHHIIYRSDQGPDTTWNLVTLCEQCHSAMHRGDLSLMEVDEQKAPFNADYELFFRAFNGWRPE